MYVYEFREINHAFKGLVDGFHTGRILTHEEDSRAGKVIVADGPVLITYTHPWERVLINQARDANPFFCLYEALWMLAGRNDVKALSYYNSKIAEVAVDPNVSWFNGAYGYRWRHSRPVGGCMDSHYDTDQLDLIVEHLKNCSNSRRAVLSMWNVEDDLMNVGGLERNPVGSKDVCCNTQVMFSVARNKHLDMTIINRSNDLIWSVLASDYVTFSILQSYMAARLGLGHGLMHLFTNNLHAYKDRWEPEKWLQGFEIDSVPSPWFNLVRHPETFEHEVKAFVEINAGPEKIHGQVVWIEPFLEKVAQPMMHVYHMWKAGDMDALDSWMDKIEHSPWRIAARHWILNRLAARRNRV